MLKCLESNKDIGRTGFTYHSIYTGNLSYIKKALRRPQEHMNANVEKHVKEMMENTIVEPSTSPMAWCWSKMVAWFCVDYRSLNAITKIRAFLTYCWQANSVQSFVYRAYSFVYPASLCVYQKNDLSFFTLFKHVDFFVL